MILLADMITVDNKINTWLLLCMTHTANMQVNCVSQSKKPLSSYLIGLFRFVIKTPFPQLVLYYISILMI